MEQVVADSRYKKNIEYGTPRSGHPEGKVKNHIIDLENNLDRLKNRLKNDDDYWKLKFLIHVHDTFKAEAVKEGTPSNHPRSHESLAREFASEFTDDLDLLNIIQNHDENYALWLQFRNTGQYNQKQFATLIKLIQDWDLFLVFTIIDGFTKGKDLAKLTWFINEVKKYKHIQVDETWAILE